MNNLTKYVNAGLSLIDGSEYGVAYIKNGASYIMDSMEENDELIFTPAKVVDGIVEKSGYDVSDILDIMFIIKKTFNDYNYSRAIDEKKFNEKGEPELPISECKIANMKTTEELLNVLLDKNPVEIVKAKIAELNPDLLVEIFESSSVRLGYISIMSDYTIETFRLARRKGSK